MKRVRFVLLVFLQVETQIYAFQSQNNWDLPVTKHHFISYIYFERLYQFIQLLVCVSAGVFNSLRAFKTLECVRPIF